MKNISLADFQHSLTTATVRTFQIIQGAIMAGTSFFFIVVIFMYITGSPGSEISPNELKSMNDFSLIHAVFFVISFPVSKFLYNRMFFEDKVKSLMATVKDDSPVSIAEGYTGVIRTALIVRMAVLEGAVYFGMVVCFMGVTGNVMYHYQYYWLNALSYAVFMYIMFKEFPSKERIVEIFKNKLGSALTYGS